MKTNTVTLVKKNATKEVLVLRKISAFFKKKKKKKSIKKTKKF